MRSSVLVLATLAASAATLAVGLMTSPALSAQAPATTGVITAPPASAQSPAAQPAPNQTFEVASVKPNKSGDGRVMIGMPNGRFTATNVPFRLLLRQAYDVQDFQIIGGPNWIASDRFDIIAKVPEGVTGANQVRPLLKALLVDRFKLVARTETREMPIYALVLAKSDGKLGANLKTSSTDCEAVLRGQRGGGPPPPPEPGQPIPCGFMIGPGNMNAGNMPMLELARSLSGFVGRTVIDKTGLKDRYDFQLTYTPEGRGGGPLGPLPGGAPEPPGAADPNRPSLFTALQEQLGLKLDSQRGPVEVLVIESVEQPTAD
jgi:uncharacterized protein (TIGR03435 family)